MMRLFVSICVAVLLLAGCSLSDTISSSKKTTELVISNPTALDILSNNPQADIFQYKDIIYTNATHIEWVQQVDLTIGNIVGTIQKQYQFDLPFEEEMATKLPVGTEIYEPDKKRGPILIVLVDGEEIRYLGLIEG